jgi:hypothetical protein
MTAPIIGHRKSDASGRTVRTYTRTSSGLPLREETSRPEESILRMRPVQQSTRVNANSGLAGPGVVYPRVHPKQPDGMKTPWRWT